MVGSMGISSSSLVWSSKAKKLSYVDWFPRRMSTSLCSKRDRFQPSLAHILNPNSTCLGRITSSYETCATVTLTNRYFSISDTVLYHQPKRRLLHFMSLNSVNLHRAAESLDPMAAQLIPLHSHPVTDHLTRSVEQARSCSIFAMVP